MILACLNDCRFSTRIHQSVDDDSDSVLESIPSGSPRESASFIVAMILLLRSRSVATCQDSENELVSENLWRFWTTNNRRSTISLLHRGVDHKEGPKDYRENRCRILFGSALLPCPGLSKVKENKNRFQSLVIWETGLISRKSQETEKISDFDARSED